MPSEFDPERKPGWVAVAALGISIVAAGQYVAWNFGLASGGWLGMLLAVGFAAALYITLSLCMAELSAMFPSEAATFEFVRQGFGARLALIAGWCVVVEFVCAGSALAAFVAAYAHAGIGLHPYWLMLFLYVASIGLQLVGARETIKLTQVMAVIAVGGILLTLVALIVSVPERPFGRSLSQLSFPGVTQSAAAAWAAVPFSVAMFLGIEGVALAAEEVRDPRRSIPRGMFAGVGFQCLFAIMLVGFLPLTLDLSGLSHTDDPIAFAWRTMGQSGTRGSCAKAALVCALVALAASFFSVMFAYSHQVHALARAGFLPRAFASVGSHRTPILALLAPAIVSMGLAAFCDAELLIVIMVFGATASYALIFLAHLRLRRIAPDVPRSYRVPAVWIPVLGILLAAATFIACVRNQVAGGVLAGLVIAALTGTSLLVAWQRSRGAHAA